jgi:MarR family 2-MHQ and catechol resistance regulon transcriptional repressor
MPGDRRVVLAELTPEGDVLLERVMPEHCGRIREAWSGVTAEERLLLIHTMLKLRRDMAPRAPEHCQPSPASYSQRDPSVATKGELPS